MTSAWQVGSPGPPVGSATAEGTSTPAPIAPAASATTSFLIVLLPCLRPSSSTSPCSLDQRLVATKKIRGKGLTPRVPVGGWTSGGASGGRSLRDREEPHECSNAMQYSALRCSHSPSSCRE